MWNRLFSVFFLGRKSRSFRIIFHIFQKNFRPVRKSFPCPSSFFKNFPVPVALSCPLPPVPCKSLSCSGLYVHGCRRVPLPAGKSLKKDEKKCEKIWRKEKSVYLCNPVSGGTPPRDGEMKKFIERLDSKQVQASTKI